MQTHRLLPHKRRRQPPSQGPEAHCGCSLTAQAPSERTHEALTEAPRVDELAAKLVVAGVSLAALAVFLYLDRIAPGAVSLEASCLPCQGLEALGCVLGRDRAAPSAPGDPANAAPPAAPSGPAAMAAGDSDGLSRSNDTPCVT